MDEEKALDRWNKKYKKAHNGANPSFKDVRALYDNGDAKVTRLVNNPSLPGRYGL